MTYAASLFFKALRAPHPSLTKQSVGCICLPLLMAACGGPSSWTARDSMGPVQPSTGLAPEVGEDITTGDDEADSLAAMDSSVDRPIGRRPGDPVGSDEEEVESVRPVRADLTALMDKYLLDRVHFGSPLAWHGHLPRIACDLGPYQLVEVELTSPFVGGAAADRVWGVLIAPHMGHGYDPNHADCWFARRLSAVSGRSSFTSLFHTPVLRRLP